MRKFYVLILLLEFCGCRQNPQLPTGLETSYYYWQPYLNLTSQDGQFFQKQKTRRLYIRFFDLDWDAKTQNLYSRAELHSGALDGLPIEIVPVVFITPKALAHLQGPGQASQFILKRCKILSRSLGRYPFSEIQLDCDWTPISREPYFNLLTQFKQELQRLYFKPLLSATIRLHQVKYRTITGIPPVDRGILMVYHTSAAQELTTKNTLLDEDDALSYLIYLKSYPLPLDVALPLFHWGVQFNSVRQLLKIFHIQPDDPVIGQSFNHLSGTLYQAKADVYLCGIRFMKNDYLKVEESDPEVALRLESWILQQHPNVAQRVIWFDYSCIKGKL
jgi:hypothetical protein